MPSPRAGHHEVCLDAARVRFTDGAGLRALVDQARRFRAVGGRLEMVNVSDPLWRLLEAADLLGQLGLDREVRSPASRLQ